jgi:glycosyltransferase involved in cell wall biosynthesis
MTKTLDISESHTPIPEKNSITAIILTMNEEIHIERCIERIAPLVARVVVVDSGSTDRTIDIATRLGADVTQRAFKHQADQFQWALDHCGVRTEWVLRLDADEYLEETLIADIEERVPRLPKEVTGLAFKRKVIFRKRWIRFGAYYSTILTRMWRVGAGAYEQRWMDEKLVLKHGRFELIKSGDLVDENLKDIDWWTDKHNRYATRQMVDFINREYRLFPMDEAIDPNAPAQARWIRFLRNHIFANAPLYVRSVLYFIYRYIFKFGFLDGRQGFVFHALHGFWYFMLIDAKIDEARGFIRNNGVEAFREHLARRHKIAL